MSRRRGLLAARPGPASDARTLSGDGNSRCVGDRGVSESRGSGCRVQGSEASGGRASGSERFARRGHGPGSRVEVRVQGSESSMAESEAVLTFGARLASRAVSVDVVHKLLRTPVPCQPDLLRLQRARQAHVSAGPCAASWPSAGSCNASHGVRICQNQTGYTMRRKADGVDGQTAAYAMSVPGMAPRARRKITLCAMLVPGRA
eukprot:3635083-Rhodomonas_salina.1